MKLPIVLIILLMTQQPSFKETQLQHTRVKLAYQEKENTVKNYFNNINLNNQGASVFLRAFKKEMALEVWVKPKNKDQYLLLHTYNFCALSGTLGPKRKRGDLQVPEGIYQIDYFNPVSNFHLSLGLNYPNASDVLLGDKKSPGSDIYIHGNCVTVGCIPITDDKIKELYVLMVEARNDGQKTIPVHIFPTRLNVANYNTLSDEFKEKPTLLEFWKNLKPIYEDFEQTKKLRTIKVNPAGSYYF